MIPFFDENSAVCNRLLGVTFIFVILLNSGCASNLRREMTPASTPLAMTSTLAAPPAPSETPLPVPSQPTTAPVEGITSTQVNVRAEPSTASTVLGVIPADMRVEITGKDPGEGWWQINYPQGVDGKGWVTAQYVRMVTQAEVPVIGGTEVNPGSGNLAIVQQQLNVRSGPGTDFNSLGTLNPQDVVSLTGKDPNGAWLQIDFPAGPEGKGWVNAAFVQAQGAENLPIIAESGLVIGTGTPTDIPSTSTPTVVPAWEDGDSAADPIARVIFESDGTQTFMYNGDLSSPQGDAEDWIAFSPYDQFLFVVLECQGSGSITLEVLENNSPISTYMECGVSMTRVRVNPGSDYLVHLQSMPSAEKLQYTNYILTIKMRP